MKAMLKKVTNIGNVHEEDFSTTRAITVVALLVTFVATTIYLMVTCYSH